MKEASIYTGIPTGTLYDWAGIIIPAIKIAGHGKGKKCKILFDMKDLDNFLVSKRIADKRKPDLKKKAQDLVGML
ncbi:MAG: hypothetical protein OEY64_03605 [Nitrospinota bacterium]|nr:hypothetical protein [Nitrospinota bacterium]